jgi:dienelactone hydrolase
MPQAMPSRRRRILQVLSVLATLVGAGCGESPLDASDAPVGPGDAGLDATLDAAPLAIEALGTSTFTEDSRTWTETRYRLRRADGRATYVQWIPSDKPGPRPVVVVTMPYAGIDWTGEALDLRWAGYPLTAGQHLDVDGPGFDGTGMIVYDPTPLAAVIDQSRLHRLNDCATLLIYGRFYAGGDVRDDIADMAAGMAFLAEQPAIDRARVGVFGGSWGGFEALYAAAHADPRLPAMVVSAMYPPTDFAGMYAHATTRTGAARAFMTPYVRRIVAATGGPPGTGDYRGLGAADLCAGLPPATLLLHDEHDNLVPIAQSQAVARGCGAALVTWPRTGAIDPAAVSHGPLLTDEPSPQSVYTYATAFLHLRLAPPDQQVVIDVVHATALRTHLGLVRAAQQAGHDVAAVAPRLRDLADRRLYLLDLGATMPSVRAGAEVTADAVNAVWGTSYTAATIDAALATGLPPP